VRQPLFAHRPLVTLLPRPRVAAERALHRGEQLFLVDRLEQEVHRSSLHRADRRQHISLTGEEHERQRPPGARQRGLQLEAAHLGHLQIDDRAARVHRGCGREESSRRVERLHRVAGELEQPRECLSHHGIVVHQEHRRFVGLHRVSLPTAAGIAQRIIVPPPGRRSCCRSARSAEN
jgi:hypothetical protein